MFIRMADFNIKINNKYKYLEYLCKDYIIDCVENIDFDITVTDEEIEEELQSSTIKFNKDYTEAIVCYRKICESLPKYDSFLFHASTIEINGKAYLFSAKAGTGKTTHTRLLKEYLKDGMSWVNGDKPIIRFIDGIPYAYGTPWNGKENYGENKKAPCKALIFIERSIDNFVEDLPKAKVLPRIIHQILLTSDSNDMDKLLYLIDKFINYVDTYVVHCNMELDAAKCTYDNIINK